jgi:mannose-1-phosphate guanylyltransferase
MSSATSKKVMLIYKPRQTLVEEEKIVETKREALAVTKEVLGGNCPVAAIVAAFEVAATKKGLVPVVETDEVVKTKAKLAAIVEHAKDKMTKNKGDTFYFALLVALTTFVAFYNLNINKFFEGDDRGGDFE